MDFQAAVLSDKVLPLADRAFRGNHRHQGFACLHPLVIQPAVNLNHKIAALVLFKDGEVALDGGYALLGSGDGVGIMRVDVALQNKPFVGVAAFQEFQPRHLVVHRHLLSQQGVRGRNGLDFGGGQDGFVHVLAGAGHAFARHNLRDIPQFLLLNLP